MKTTNNIEKGTFLRNGGNRHFMITEITDSKVTMEAYNADGPTGKALSLNRSTFDGLYRLKNYEVVRFAYSIKENRWKEKRDLIADTMIGANRCMIKQF